MTDWLSPMQQTFEYYIVDPISWRDVRKINDITSSTINMDLSAETLGSATINSESPLGECYVRIYLVTIQNDRKNRYPLGVFLIQTPSYNFNGKRSDISVDAYTPLLELKEKLAPLGYSIIKGENILDSAYKIIREQMRGPIIKTTSDDQLHANFVANIDDTWITFIYDLLANAGYTLQLDELGRVLFAPIQETSKLQPVWTYDDGNSSILYPDLDISHDLYGIPNVVEVIYSTGNGYLQGRAVNNDENSPVSIINRGREIVHRVSNPDILGNPTESQIKDYAEKLLKELSSLEYTITYTHGYCPVRIGDCVRLNYKKAGVYGIKAKVIQQTINCTPGCPVTEKATFNTNLWR